MACSREALFNITLKPRHQTTHAVRVATAGILIPKHHPRLAEDLERRQPPKSSVQWLGM
jgi:hypothetical protein